MPSISERLLLEQNECVLSWIKNDGSPASTVVSFIYRDGRIWMTALEGTGRVRAIRLRPRVSIAISGKGCEVGHSRCISMQGSCEIFTDQSSRDKFFPDFSRAVLPNSEAGAAMMAQMMNSPENLVLAMKPDKTIPYDAQAMLDQANQV